MKTDRFGVQYSDCGKELILFPSKLKGDYIIPQGVEKIRSYSFSYCRFIDKIVLPDSLTTIEHRAFDTCKIGEIHLSKSIKYIESGAFRGNEINKFVIAKENPYYKISNNNCIISKRYARLMKLGTNCAIPEGVKQIGTFSILIFKDSQSNILIIPEGVERLNELCIIPSINSKLELHLPSTIKRIDYQEWTDECDCITKIVVPKGHKKRFSRMKNLQEIKHIVVEAEE